MGMVALKKNIQEVADTVFGLEGDLLKVAIEAFLLLRFDKVRSWHFVLVVNRLDEMKREFELEGLEIYCDDEAREDIEGPFDGINSLRSRRQRRMVNYGSTALAGQRSFVE